MSQPIALLAGFELTFTNATLIDACSKRGDLGVATREHVAAAAAFADALRSAIGDHAYAVESDGDNIPRHVITYPDGYWIKIELDPWVVEVTGTPLTLAGYQAHRFRFAQLFAVAHRVGLEPHQRIGGGHIHFDRSSFGSHATLRNVIVDYVNRPALALGVLGFDLLNAPPLALAPRSAIRAFADGVDAYDHGSIDMDGWLRHIRTRVYTHGSPDLPTSADPAKYQALNVNHASTIEIRAIRPQRGIDELCSIIQAFQTRATVLAEVPAIPFALA